MEDGSPTSYSGYDASGESSESPRDRSARSLIFSSDSCSPPSTGSSSPSTPRESDNGGAGRHPISTAQAADSSPPSTLIGCCAKGSSNWSLMRKKLLPCVEELKACFSSKPRFPPSKEVRKPPPYVEELKAYFANNPRFKNQVARETETDSHDSGAGGS